MNKELDMMSHTSVSDVARENAMWWRAMWAVHDMCMYGVTRLETFRRLVSYGLDRRSAAELMSRTLPVRRKVPDAIT